MSNIIDAHKVLEERWIGRAYGNVIEGKGNGRYGQYRDTFIYSVVTKKELVTEQNNYYSLHRNTASVYKMPKGTNAVAVKMYKKLEEQAGWDIYFPSNNTIAKIDDDEIEDTVDFAQYDASIFDDIVALFDNKEYKFSIFDRSSFIETYRNNPYIRMNISLKNNKKKEFKCSITYSKWNDWVVEAEIYGIKHRTSVQTKALVLTNVKNFLNEFSKLKNEDGVTFEYNGQEITLSPGQASRMNAQGHYSFLLKTDEWLLEFHYGAKQTVDRQLGDKYGFPVVHVPELNRYVFVLLPIELASVPLYNSLFKNKKELK